MEEHELYFEKHNKVVFDGKTRITCQCGTDLVLTEENATLTISKGDIACNFCSATVLTIECN